MTTPVIILSIVIFFLLFAISGYRKQIYILKCEKNIERNQAVYWYRKFVFKIHPEDYLSLPSYDDMLNGDYDFRDEYKKILDPDKA